MNYDGDRFTTTVVELLGVQAARLTNLKGTPPCAQITLRLNPSESWGFTNIALTQKQSVRLRDDLDSLLRDPSSWLFTEEMDEAEDDGLPQL